MAKPLVRVQYIMEYGCDYPVAVRIPMDDGTVQTYALENKMDFKLEKLKKDIEKSVMIGYQYKGKHTKKNRVHMG